MTISHFIGKWLNGLFVEFLNLVWALKLFQHQGDIFQKNWSRVLKRELTHVDPNILPVKFEFS